jgi:FkbM family methyltransferase
LRSWKPSFLLRGRESPTRERGPAPEADSLATALVGKPHSQGNEELLIGRFFGDRRGGVFVDVGAGHWCDGSNTYFLERDLGWSGIAVDALSELESGYDQNRPGTEFFNYVVTDHSGTIDRFYVAGALSSTRKEHLEAFSNVDADRAPVVGVPAITLTDLLDAQRVTEIDLLSMDIEQGEPEALTGFDLARFRPRLVCVEVGTDRVRDWVGPYFAAARYERIEDYLAHDIANWYFRPAAG